MPPNYTVQQVKNHITNCGTMAELDPVLFCEEDGMADSLARSFPRGSDLGELRSTQLRKVFQGLRAVQRLISRESPNNPFWTEHGQAVARILPMLAYAAGRKLLPRDFYDILKVCLSPQKLQTNADFARVDEFVTAILAYHKYRNA